MERRTLLPSWINSARVDSKNPRHVNFAEQYAAWRGMPMKAKAEPTLTMFPWSRAHPFESGHCPPHLAQKSDLDCSAEVLGRGIGEGREVGCHGVVHPDVDRPELVLRHRRRGSTASKLATSVGTIRPARCAPQPGEPQLRGRLALATSATSKPRSARALAVARPTPADAPVTSAVFRFAIGASILSCVPKSPGVGRPGSPRFAPSGAQQR